MIYRPPDTNVAKFNECLDGVLSKIKSEKKSCYLLGDYNINLLNSDKHPATQEFIDTMFSYSMLPCITKPTRVNSKTATLIDNIFHNDLSIKSTFAGILYTDITDHFPVFLIDHSSKRSDEPKFIRARNYCPDNIAAFSMALRAHDWSAVMLSGDPQEAYSTFHKLFLRLYEKFFPVKSVKIGYKNNKPWLSDGLKKSIKLKNKLFFKQKRTNKTEDINRYKTYRNKLNSLLKRAEKEHYERLLQDNKCNLKKSWSIIKEVINKKKNTNSCSRFVVNDKITTNKKSISDGFNSYFINIGPNLARRIPSVNKCPTDVMKNKNDHSIFLAPVVESEVLSVIKCLKPSSAGWDEFTAKVVKATNESFITPLTHVINLSLSCGVFPNELKIARVIPLLKSGDPMQFNNYLFSLRYLRELCIIACCLLSTNISCCTVFNLDSVLDTRQIWHWYI